MKETSLWKRVDDRRAPQSESLSEKRRLRWVVDVMLPLALAVIADVTVLLPASLPSEACPILFSFALATIFWAITKLNAAYVVLGAVMLPILVGGRPQEQLFDALASDVVWLMIGAFVGRCLGLDDSKLGRHQ